MPTARKVVGEAVAVKRGHYPTPDGLHVVVRMPGDKFPLLQGLEKGSWFQAASKPLPPEPDPPVKAHEPKAPPNLDDSASLA